MTFSSNSTAPDIHSSTEAYARRFSGSLGEWLLHVQEVSTDSLLLPLDIKQALDVGGGHAQNISSILKSGACLTVLGSKENCRQRLEHHPQHNDTIFFTTGCLTDIPYSDNSFDMVMSYRILPHIGDWKKLIKELCRVSRKAVLVDFPVWRSVNILSKATFNLKKSLEGNTRPYRVFHEREITKAFTEQGFELTGKTPQFFLPMALHRLHRSPALAKGLEAIPRTLMLTKFFGSPIIARFEKKKELS